MQPWGMGIRSSEVASERPFYDLHAESYDALITDSVYSWVEAIDDRMRKEGKAGVSILDVGCGTGRHARALIERGYEVSLMDASPALLAIAKRRCTGSATYHADVTDVTLEEKFEAIACRGVLNDLIEDEERESALQSFAGLLITGGLLFLDVRDAAKSAARAHGTWREKTVDLPNAITLTYSSRPTWQSELIIVDETYTLLDHTTGTQEHQEWIIGVM